MATIETDLHVRIWGDGHPERVVFLHGGNVPDPQQVWQAQLPLAEQYEVVVVDRRGFGLSPDAERISWESEIADALMLLGERAHVVGHSFGGVIALLVAGATRSESAHWSPSSRLLLDLRSTSHRSRRTPRDWPPSTPLVQRCPPRSSSAAS